MLVFEHIHRVVIVVYKFIIATLLVWSNSVSLAQEMSAFEERARHYTTHVDGKSQPSKIDPDDKLEFLLNQYVRRDLAGVIAILPASDIDTFQEFLASERLRRVRVSSMNNDVQDWLCSAADTEPVELLLAETKRQELANKDDRRRAYKKLRRSLSGAGRRALENFIDANVVPNLSFVQVDMHQLWKEFPNMYLANLRGRCNASPEDMRRVIQEQTELEYQSVDSASSSTSDFGSIPE